MAENEVYFRTQNEKLQKSINEANKIAEEENESPFDLTGRTQFFFRCECSNEDCHERIELTLDEYNETHKQRNKFLVIKGHQVQAIETVTEKRSDFYVVTKDIELPSKVEHLNATSL